MVTDESPDTQGRKKTGFAARDWLAAFFIGFVLAMNSRARYKPGPTVEISMNLVAGYDLVYLLAYVQ